MKVRGPAQPVLDVVTKAVRNAYEQPSPGLDREGQTRLEIEAELETRVKSTAHYAPPGVDLMTLETRGERFVVVGSARKISDQTVGKLAPYLRRLETPLRLIGYGDSAVGLVDTCTTVLGARCLGGRLIPRAQAGGEDQRSESSVDPQRLDRVPVDDRARRKRILDWLRATED